MQDACDETRSRLRSSAGSSRSKAQTQAPVHQQFLPVSPNLAQADRTVLTTVVSQDPVYVYFDCDEQSYLRFLRRTHRGSGVTSANPVHIALANETGFPH